MPNIEFVNLSLNFLQTPIKSPPVHRMNNLRSLVLNNTKLNWHSVEVLLKILPLLEELHLSLNDYTNVLLDTVESEKIKKHNNLNHQDQEMIDQSRDECNYCDTELQKYKKTEGNVNHDF